MTQPNRSFVNVTETSGLDLTRSLGISSFDQRDRGSGNTNCFEGRRPTKVKETYQVVVLFRCFLIELRTLPETNISSAKAILKMIFLFQRWDMLGGYSIWISLYLLPTLWYVHIGYIGSFLRFFVFNVTSWPLATPPKTNECPPKKDY